MEKSDFFYILRRKVVMDEQITINYNKIKNDVRQIIDDEIQRISDDPKLRHLLEKNK